MELKYAIVLFLFSSVFDRCICDGHAIGQISRDRRQAFELPHVTVEAFLPKGFQAYIPDSNSISLFAFHGKLNEPVENLEAGEFSADVTRSKDGRWTYRNSRVKLEIGDTINFWAYVEHRDKDGTLLGHRIDDGMYTVTGFTNDNKEADTSSSAQLPTIKIPCIQSESKISSSEEKICEGQLLFEDTFAVPNQINQQWSNEVKFPTEPDKPFVYYSGKKENIFVDNDKLSIKLQLLEDEFGEEFVTSHLDLGDPCTASSNNPGECKFTTFETSILPPIISGKLHTRNTFSFKYGRVEVIAKLPKGDWIYPEILLEPKDMVYGRENYASGIIRIASAKGYSEQSKVLQSGMIIGVQPTLRQYGIREKISGESWGDKFHNYTLLWKPESMSMFVDGKQYGSIIPAYDEFLTARRRHNESGKAPLWRGTNMAPFDEMFYISLSVAVGGKVEFPDTSGKPWMNSSPNSAQNFWQAKNAWFPSWSGESSTLQVDSVRVYAL